MMGDMEAQMAATKHQTMDMDMDGEEGEGDVEDRVEDLEDALRRTKSRI